MGRRRAHPPLNIFINNRLAGRLLKQAGGAIEFRYDQSWLPWEHAFPISLSLPLRESQFTGEPVVAVFDNLLPDNAAVRRRVRGVIRGLPAADPDRLRPVDRLCRFQLFPQLLQLRWRSADRMTGGGQHLEGFEVPVHGALGSPTPSRANHGRPSSGWYARDAAAHCVAVQMPSDMIASTTTICPIRSFVGVIQASCGGQARPLARLNIAGW